MDSERPEMAAEDHRTRVAAERRERMQARLVESAPLPDGYSAHLASAILGALGVPVEEAQAIALRPLPRLRLPPDTLLAAEAEYQVIGILYFGMAGP